MLYHIWKQGRQTSPRPALRARRHIQEAEIVGKRLWKRILSAALAAVLLLTPVFAAEGGDTTPPPTSGDCGSGVAWSFNNGELEISGSGAMTEFASASAVPWSAHVDKIKSVSILEGVTTIGAYAFYRCKNLENVKLPRGNMTAIGKYAFSGCGSLAKIELPKSLVKIDTCVFLDCVRLEEIIIPSSVTGVGTSAFEGCTELRTASLSDKMTEISDYAFKGCSHLEGITIPEGVTKIGDSAFQDCSELGWNPQVTLPDSLTSIGEEAFMNCQNLRQITFPAKLASIGARAFYRAGLNDDIEVPASVTSVGTNAFFECMFSYIHYFGDETVGKTLFKEYLGNGSGMMEVHFVKDVGKVEPSDCMHPGHEAGKWCDDCRKGFDGLESIPGEHELPPAPEHIERKQPYPPVPKCEEADSVLYYRCTRCSRSVVVEAKAAIEPHTPTVKLEGIPATCTETGFTPQTACMYCSMIMQERKEIPALGHTMVPEKGEPATCTEPGHKDGEICSTCGFDEREEIPALGHDLEEHKAVPSTCETDGHAAYKICKREGCGYQEGKNEVVRPNKKHNEKEEEVPGTNTATCGKEGTVKIRIFCTNVNEDNDPCEYYKIEERKSPINDNHTPKAVEYLAPTCTEKGHEAGTMCEVCGVRIKDARPIPALGHKFDEKVDVIKEATCTEDGLKRITSTCTVCKTAETKEEKIPAGHKPGPDSAPVIDKAPTCGEAGSQHVTSKCTVCGKEFTQTSVIPATGKHTFSEWTVTTEPSETAQGMKERTCKVCKFKEVEMIPATGEPEVETFTVTFNANGGTLAGETTRTTDADGRLLTLPVPTRSGYDFQGWFTAADGGDRIMSDHVYTKDTTLYAHWQRDDGSSGGDDAEPPDGGEYPVYWDRPSHGTLSVSPTRAKSGSTVTVRVYPDSGYELRSLWIVDRNGRQIRTSSSSWNRYTFTMPNSYVDIDVSFSRSRGGSSTSAVTSPVTPGTQNVPTYPSPTFYGQPAFDVPAGYWAAGEIGWAIQNGYMITTMDGAFLPDSQVDYQQIWSVLTQVLAKSGISVTENSLRSIRSGLADGKDPSAPASRQEIVTALYRCAYLVKGGKITGGDLKGFADASRVSGYAKEAMGWAAANGIINGTADGKLNPTANITRAQYAVLLYRFCQNI